MLWAKDEKTARDTFESHYDYCLNAYSWGWSDWGDFHDDPSNPDCIAFTVALLRVPETWQTSYESNKEIDPLQDEIRVHLDDCLITAAAVASIKGDTDETGWSDYSPIHLPRAIAVTEAIQRISNCCFGW